MNLSWGNCCVSVRLNVSSVWIRHLEESRCSDIKSNQPLQVSHRFLEQKCNVKSKSLWSRRYGGPTRKLLFLGLNPSCRSLNCSRRQNAAAHCSLGLPRLLQFGLTLGLFCLRQSVKNGFRSAPHSRRDHVALPLLDQSLLLYTLLALAKELSDLFFQNLLVWQNLLGEMGTFCINWDRDVWKHQMNNWEKQPDWADLKLRLLFWVLQPWCEAAF